MKKILLSLLLCSAAATLTPYSYADDDGVGSGNSPIINKITLQLKSSQWLQTKTALVTVSVNAAVNDQGIDKIQNEVMQKLTQIAAKSDWHITDFNRQQDKAGLESLSIHAQARVAQTALADLRNNAKSVSKPGETFTIDNIDFTPADDEIRAANTALRNDIYQQAKAEIDALNNIYLTQKYYLHQIDFIQTPIVMPMAANVTMSRMAAPAPLSVGNKAELQATVVLASMPELPSNLPRAH
jgi:hypothetical protein